jgi:thiol-disulfide isomerase/thioredoxin
MRFHQWRWLAALLLAGTSTTDCSAPRPLPPDAPARSSLLLSGAFPAPQPGGLHALLINGGAGFESNYRSHLQHLERLLALLAKAGVEPGNISVFASDGTDPTPDLAVLDEKEPEDLWLLPDAGLGELLGPQMQYVSTRIEGTEPRSATRAQLEKWFREEGSRIPPGDTLLVFVTDHGNRNDADPDDNTISLWNGETLGVREFQQYLDQIDPGVRVVMLMSQCFGGAFANAIYAGGESGALRGNVCGYFATTADRPAWGCYPENRGREGVGHSMEVFEAWEQLGELLRAHRRTLVSDDMPDVPNTSRDFELARLLRAEAQRAGDDPDAFVDHWLRQAWKDRAAWEPEIRLLDQIGHAFGLFSPRSLAEFEDEAKALPELSDQLETYADRWDEALEAARREVWLRFAEEHADWPPRLERNALRALEPAQREALRAELLAAYAPFVRAEPETHERLLGLRRKAEDAAAAHYRTEVRIAALLRMRTLLTSIAGRTWLESSGSPGQRAGDEGLARCEALSVSEPRHVAAYEPPTPLPPLEDDRKRIESVMPAWMGIRYQPVRARPGAGSELPRGAVQVMTVYPDSPAAAAGLKVADIVLGTPGRPFEETHAIREWTMTSTLGRAAQLELRRGGRTIDVTLVPGPFPLQLPALPGPPKVGSPAPALELELYRGVRLADARPQLLFFWATWCGPCKQSLPELLAFAAARSVDVVAITDEDPAQLEPFLREHTDFPANVASDPLRAAFQAYGVAGTPTFVLIGSDGVIQLYQRGYSAERGLQVEGWIWPGRG